MIEVDRYQRELSDEDIETLRTSKKEADYGSLHQHSDFSILDGFASVDMIFQRAAKLGHSFTGIADHGTVAAHLKAERAGIKYGVKPVFGIEAYVVPRPIQELKAEKAAEKSKERIKNSHGCLWAMNQQGLRNLWTLATLSTLPENTYYKPLMSFDMLREHSEGLFFSDGCLLSDTARWIVDEEIDLAVGRAIELQDIFGDRFVSELHTFQIIEPKTDEDRALNLQIRMMNKGKIEIAQKLGIRTIACLDDHYAFEHDHENHDMVWSMNTSYTADQVESRGKSASWLMSGEDVDRFLISNGLTKDQAKEAKANTLWLADQCNVEIPKGVHHPTVRNDLVADLDLFEATVEEGFRRKTHGMPPEDVQKYRERVDLEKGVITKNNFHGYFNVVADYVRYAKMSDPEGEHGPFKGKTPWLSGPARGSGGGSLVGELMGITEIDAIKYGLIFERFLNEGRIEAGEFPDYDVDFAKSRLRDIKAYLRWKYGENNICGVSTYGRGKPKSLFQKLAKVFGIPYTEALALSKDIEQVEKIKSVVNEDTGDEEDADWSEVLQEDPGALQAIARQHPDLFRHLQEMLGMVMLQGVHASGVIISRQSLIGNLPMRAVVDKATGEWEWVSQFENSDKFGEDVHDMGYIKFDFLGLRHLDTLMEAQRLVRGEVDLDEFYNWPEERYLEEDMWAAIGQGDTVGLFQEETAAGTRLVKRLLPRNERDMAAVNALVRPGPTDSGMTDHYIARRFGKERVDTLHPLLADILADTYGQMVFQEQILAVVQTVASYSLVDADRVRKAVGKKNMEAINRERSVFVQGCLDNKDFVAGTRENPTVLANRIWDAIAAAGNYSFGLSHSQAYANLTCWEAWYRHHHRTEYTAALLRTDKKENAVKYIRDARANGVNILPPDVNLSGESYTLTPEGIRFGLASVKGVGVKAVADIVAKRPFNSIEDYLERCSGGANKGIVTSLVKLGAFDSLGDREEVWQRLWTWRKEAKFKDTFEDRLMPSFDDPEVMTQIEQELVGTYITQDPLGRFIPMIRESCLATPADLDDLDKGALANLGGMISRVHKTVTKAKGEPMGFMSIEWENETFEVVVFPKAWREMSTLIEAGYPVVCQVQKLEDGCCLNRILRLDRMV